MFSSSQSPTFDKLVDKATSNTLLETDWCSIIAICDIITNGEVQPKYALNLVKKKIFNSDPHVSIYALQLLDACVSNCGKSFHLEVCSRDFESDIRKIIQKSHPKVVEKVKEFVRKWSEQEFRDDPQLSLIPSLYNKLRSEGVEFPANDVPKRAKEPQVLMDPNFVTSNQEEEDIAKAIELSLKETQASSASSWSNSALYPSINNANTSVSASNMPLDNWRSPAAKEPYKVKALYDFEAAEENELTFKAGEIILVLDDTDQNWWKGSNLRSEGLFPSNFVTTDLSHEPEVKHHERKSVQFNEHVKVKLLEPETVRIDEDKIDKLLFLLHEADPTGEKDDTEELLTLEEQCMKMAPVIDQELEKIDKKHVSLSTVNTQLVEALNIYCALMKENTGNYTASYPVVPQQPVHYYQQQQAPTSPQNYPVYPQQIPGNQMMPPQHMPMTTMPNPAPTSMPQSVANPVSSTGTEPQNYYY